MSPTTLVTRFSNPDTYKLAVDKKTFDGTYSATSVIVTLSIALGLYNSLEMILLILTIFKKRRGLYFWSLTLCNLGVMLYSLGIMLLYFRLCVTWFGKVVDDIGWVVMIVFQSVVLYSRLNLIMNNETFLRNLKWYIIIDSSILVITVVVLDFGNTYAPSVPAFARAYFYVEHVQVTGFTIQEVMISSVYIWKTVELLNIISKARTRNMIWQLLIINVAIIAMDICIIILQFKHLQLYQESIKGFVYSVKLKLEINILSRLVDLVHGASTRDRSMTLAEIDSNTIIGQSECEVTQLSARRHSFAGWFIGEKKPESSSKQEDESQDSRSSPTREVTVSPLGSPQVEHVDFTHAYTPPPSSLSKRTSGREVDAMYADCLRSIRE